MSTSQLCVEKSTIEVVGDKGFIYSQLPMILLDRNGIVRRVNCALRELMRKDVAGCNDHSYQRLTIQLGNRIEGNLFPMEGSAVQISARTAGQNCRLLVDDLVVAESKCRYHSKVYGTVELRCVETPCIGTSSGEFLGSLLCVELIRVADLNGFRKALIKRLQHELMWEIYATSYDHILLEMPFYLEVLQRHFDATSGHLVHSVLDIGAGTGNLVHRLLQVGKRVTAVDITRAMLDKLRSKLDKSTCKNLTIVEDTAEDLPDLKSGTFDAVSVLLALFDMGDPFSALDEAIRLLRPHGVLIITEPKQSFKVAELMEFAESHLRKQGLFESLEEDWKHILSVAPIINQQIQEMKMPNSTDTSSLHAEDVFEILTERRFKDVTFKDSHLGNCATIMGVKS